MMKIAGNNGYKIKEFDRIVERRYQTYLADRKDCTLADFYRVVCKTVEEINKKIGSTQFNVPKIITVMQTTEYRSYTKLTKEEFEEMLQEVIVDSGFTTGFRVKDILPYIFGIPMAAFMIKQRFGPKTIPNDLFIPAITSATVFLLAKLHKI
ncbi:hypothetical protein SLE2022_134740 [Rubroshorea leprosula]